MVVRYEAVPSVLDAVHDMLESETFNMPFPRVFSEWPRFAKAEVFPYLNIAERKDDIQVVMEIPGVSKEDVKVHYHDGVLTISGERKSPEVKAEERMLRQEITYGPFSRSVELPAPVNAEKISAEYTNGILRVILPKLEEVKPKEIVVR